MVTAANYGLFKECIRLPQHTDDEEAFLEHVVLQAFLSQCEDRDLQVDDELRQIGVHAENAIPGIKFSCTMLVATSCTDLCDWHAAFECPHDLASCDNLSQESLLAHDAERTICMPYFAEFRSHSFSKASDTLQSSECCSVVGCCEGFRRAARQSHCHCPQFN